MFPPRFSGYWLIRLPNRKFSWSIEDIKARVAYSPVCYFCVPFRRDFKLRRSSIVHFVSETIGTIVLL